MGKRAKRGLYAGVTIALLVGVSIIAGCWASPRKNVENMLFRAKLSPLCPSATNVSYYQWNGLFTGETYAKFEFNKSDLRAFISNSPALQVIQPKEIYDKDHPHIPFPTNTAHIVTGPHYFYKHPRFPNWYDLTISGNGRMYCIWHDRYVYIDEDRSIVWLRFVKG